MVNEGSREPDALDLAKIAARTTRPANGLVVVLVGADDETAIPFWGGWIPHTQGGKGWDGMERMNVILQPAAMGISGQVRVYKTHEKGDGPKKRGTEKEREMGRSKGNKKKIALSSFWSLFGTRSGRSILVCIVVYRLFLFFFFFFELLYYTTQSDLYTLPI